jgi:polyhydroxybutyrate depolymerase
MNSKKILIGAIAVALVCGILAAVAHRVKASSANSKSVTMEFGGRTRRYILHIPPGHDSSKPAPLVMVLHGATQSPESAERMSRMSELADKNDFIAVYPSGTGPDADARVPTWNAGACCAYAMQNNVDDVGFLRALIDQLQRDDNIDPKRIYVTGISNGAMLSYRLACELSTKIAAIAPVEGAQDVECTPADRVSLLVFHGTADHLVPFDGGSTPFQMGSKRKDNSVAGAISFWVKKDGCSPTSEHSETAEAHTDIYSGCHDGTAVALYAIQGGHHMWPGLRISGNHVPASDIMWQFFAAHPKP